MKHINAILFISLFLLPSCTPVPSTEIPATQSPILAIRETAVVTTVPVPTATSIPCDPTTTDFCLVDWTFTFQNPLGSNSPLTIARSYPYGSTENGQRDPHRGVDIESRDGAPVYAPAAGLVIFAGRDHKRIYTPWDDYYGNLIVIQHDGGLYTLYGHLSQINVAVGDQVNGGDVIAAVGNTGVAIGSHLHFEIRTGGEGSDFFSTENPELWLPLEEGTGGMSVEMNSGSDLKFQRQLVLYRYAAGEDKVEKRYYFSSYPKSFEHNTEDWAINGLPPGRYRIAFEDSGNFYERIVTVDAGKLTQVVIQLK